MKLISKPGRCPFHEVILTECLPEQPGMYFCFRCEDDKVGLLKSQPAEPVLTRAEAEQRLTDNGDSMPIVVHDGHRVMSFPMRLLRPHQAIALTNHGGQSLDRLRDRGGLSACEAVAILERRRWHAMHPEDALRSLTLATLFPAEGGR